MQPKSPRARGTVPLPALRQGFRACSGLQTSAVAANLSAVRRSALVFTLSLTGFGSLGCAAGEFGVAMGGGHGPPQIPLAPQTPLAPQAPLMEFLLPVEAAPVVAGVTAGVDAANLELGVRGPRFTLGAPTPSSKADGAAAILRASARCPAEMALVEGRVCVDRWEASIVELVSTGDSSRAVAERGWSPFLAIDGHEHQVRAVSRPGVIPQAYISGKQAAAACSASGKRLCAVDEWEHACRGPSNFQFPYGDQRRAGVCNDDVRAVHPVAEVGRLLGIPRERLWHDGMNLPLINQLPDTLLPTGERAECTNDYGVYDMVGNLHEWVDDPAGTFRGGYYMDTTKNGDGCSYQTTAHDFAYHDYSTGFRCCMDPERVE
jgi:formylglycine-generating enzyme